MVEAPKENQPPAMPNDPAIMGVRLIPFPIPRRSMIWIDVDEARVDTLRLRCATSVKQASASEPCARYFYGGIEHNNN